MDYLKNALVDVGIDDVSHHPMVESTFWYYYYASNWNRGPFNYVLDYSKADASLQKSQDDLYSIIQSCRVVAGVIMANLLIVGVFFGP